MRKLVKESLNEALRYQGYHWNEFTKELINYEGWQGDEYEVYKYYSNDEGESEKTTLSKGDVDNIKYVVTDENDNIIDSGEFDAEGLGSGELDGELYYAMNESLNEKKRPRDSEGHKYGSKRSHYDKDGFAKTPWEKSGKENPDYDHWEANKEDEEENDYIDNDIATTDILEIISKCKNYMSPNAYNIFRESLRDIVNNEM